jgi:eukaryotic-like serine/threonine-protein kinase
LAERWEDIERLFDQACELAPAARSAFLQQACSSDAGLRAAVERLLQAHDEAAGFLEDTGPAHAAAVFASLAARERFGPGDHLGSYRIDRELGRGGMATVYLVRDQLDRQIALKVLDPEVAATCGPERFLREIRVAARFDHPHILPVHDSGETDGWLWYTMPFVDGESLRNRLQRDGPLLVEDALCIANQTADALDYAHRHGIVHRDIKPENILLASRGVAASVEQVRIADFGVAWALETGGHRLTGSGLTVGTPEYMSPEQATGAQVDGRSDVYALGCVVYEMLAGEPPYTGPTAEAVIARRLSEPIPPLGAVRAVASGLESAVTRALANAPADRFLTAGEFSEALGRGLTAPDQQ